MSALLRVAELNAAYAATIDTDKLESWPDFFVEDCLYKITSAENHKRGYSAGIVYADSARDAAGPGHGAANCQYLRATELPPYRRPAGDRREWRRTASRPKRRSWSRASCATDVRICSRRASISTGFAMRRQPAVRRTSSWSATAVISIRCWPSPYNQHGGASLVALAEGLQRVKGRLASCSIFPGAKDL